MSLNLAQNLGPLETREAEVDCLDPQAKGPAEASAQDSSADLAGKPPDYWDKQPKVVGMTSFRMWAGPRHMELLGVVKPGPVKASGSGQPTQGWGEAVGKRG